MYKELSKNMQYAYSTRLGTSSELERAGRKETQDTQQPRLRIQMSNCPGCSKIVGDLHPHAQAGPIIPSPGNPSSAKQPQRQCFAFFAWHHSATSCTSMSPIKLTVKTWRSITQVNWSPGYAVLRFLFANEQSLCLVWESLPVSASMCIHTYTDIYLSHLLSLSLYLCMQACNTPMHGSDLSPDWECKESESWIVLADFRKFWVCTSPYVSQCQIHGDPIHRSRSLAWQVSLSPTA